ncbi:hypothetical protein COY26_02610 [Candidatus Woesearchaeota archaeon CG_4_10_14_0_2_um_filter_33_10]|nr:MAG: hypothetical protein COS79_03855 [Candidatus Woesearchaeota archaeon CG06_land_8_20_14_3_00_33_13]PIZ53207.1 MAG: hypothetical protein COY26_02610 [Candidatus Woesearchaeota archaeon CG_4_10_14_0_2_um_filter_33_10]
MNLSDEKDIFLVICPAWGVQMPPLGLAYLATNLKKKGISLDVLDLNIGVYKRVDDSLKEFWKFENNKHWCDWDKDFKELFKEEIEYCVKRILSFQNTKIYAFSVQATNRLFSIEVIKRIKEANPDKIIIVGGVGCFDDREREQIFPLELVDFFIVGEGEVSLFELVDRLKKDISIENIPGVVYYKNKEKRFTLPQLIEPLDKLYFPTYEEFNLEDYTEKSLALTMSRGCISICAFCNDWKMMGKYRTRTAEHMFKEIKYHVKKNKITNFYFNDLLINGNIKELEKLCDLIIKSKYNLTWIALAIPLDSMNYNLLVKIKKAGCITLNYGVESGSDRVLKIIGKPISVNSVEKVLELTKKVGINTQINFIVGFPGETYEDFNKTLKFIRRNRTNICGITNINICNVVAGSEFSINPKKYGIIFPSEQEPRDSHWYTFNGNVFEERERRAENVISVLKDLNIPIFTTNLKEKVTDISEIHTKTKIADIALVTLPPWDIETPPVGLGYLAEYLISKEIDIKVFDFNIEFFNRFKEKYSYLWRMNNQKYWFNKILFKKFFKIFKEEIDSCVDKILSSNIKIVAFSVANPKERITIETIKKLKEKKPELKIILGGSSCNFDKCRNIFIENIPDLVDAYVIGEGEEILLEIIKAINNNEELGKIKGVVIYKNGKYSKLIKREPLDYKRIDIFPTYSKFDLSKYTNHNMLTVEWSRGCIGNCNFCQHKAIWGNYRLRTAENIVSEIKYHVRKNNIKYFFVCDSAINGDLKQLEEICDLIIKLGLKIKWNALAIPRKMSYRLLKKLKKAGCYRLYYGTESGSNPVLRLMRKIHSVNEAEETLKLTHKAKIEVALSIIVGFPGETDNDFNKTLEFIRRNKDYIDLMRSINGLYIMEGTDIEKNPEKYGIIVPKDDETGYKWYTTNGNNSKERNKKIRKVNLLLDELGIKHELDTLFETKKITALNDKRKESVETEKPEKKRMNVSYKKDKSIVQITKKFLNIRNLFKNINNINKTEQIRKKLIPTPKYVTIDLTNSCNLNCIGCWTHSPLLKDKEATNEWKSQIIPFDKLKKLIDDLYDLGTERIRLTGGGEPFLYSQIMDIIKLIKEKGMACDITTNFTLLNKEKIKELFELNVDELVVSLWAGDAETYVKTHPNQTEKTFEKIKENLEFIAQYKEKLRKGPKVIMANVILKINYDKIEEMVKFATHVSLDELYFTLVDPIKDRTDCLLLNAKERKILLKKLKKVIKIIEAYNKKSKIHKIRIDDINRFIAKMKSKKANWGKYDFGVLNKPCYIGWIFSRVLANGNIVPCCRAVMYSMGNINKKSFKDIWFSEEYDKFRERALYESKLSPYFKRVSCFMTCDNQVHNREIETINV